MAAMPHPRYTLRPWAPADLPFLAALYASIRAEEMAPVPWSEADKQRFLQQQFDLQHQHYLKHYPGASLDVLLVEDQAVGRLYVHRGRTEIRIMDIAVIPAWQGQGVGGYWMQQLQQEAQATGRILGIHVEQMNWARQWYQRLGFAEVKEVGVYLKMEWTAPSTKDSHGTHIQPPTA